MTVLAGETALWLALGLAAGFEGAADHIADVQRFIALTEARSLVPAGPPLRERGLGAGSYPTPAIALADGRVVVASFPGQSRDRGRCRPTITSPPCQGLQFDG